VTRPLPRPQPAGRELYAALHLLDRQVVDARTGRPVAKVDDLELDLEHDPPTVAAILTGPQAWGPRFPGLFGRAVVAVHRRLHPGPDPEPCRVPAALVTDVSSAVSITGEPPEGVNGLGRWLDEQLVGRIPGAGDAPE
jgi:hypothetical protein